MEVDEENPPQNRNSSTELSPSPILPQEAREPSPAPPPRPPFLQPPAATETPLPVPPPRLPPPAPIASIPAVPPLAPLPLRPTISRPPPAPPSVTQNGDPTGSEDSDSDSESSVPPANQSSSHFEISEESKQVRERQEKAMQELLMKRRAYALAVPTNDSAVRARLRRLGEPITMFGEREMERRDRLRMIMVKLDAEGQLDRLLKAHEDEEAAAGVGEEEAEGEGSQSYPFYTEGSKALLEARVGIAKYSIVKAALRIERARRRMDDPDEDVDAEMDWALEQVKTLVLDCSEIGDDRPLTGCSFSRDGDLLATWYLVSCSPLFELVFCFLWIYFGG